MPNPAIVADVTSRWPSLSPLNQTVAQVRLDDAWDLLKQQSSGLEARVAASGDVSRIVAQVLANAVIRLLQNPQGYRKGSVSIDDATRTWELGDQRALGELYFTDAELATVAAGTGVSAAGRAFTIVPS